MNQGWKQHGDREVFYTSPLLEQAGVRHLFSTRLGGVSCGCFGGWNFAAGVGDEQDSEAHVLQNYALAAAVFGLQASDICRSYQTHSDVVLTVDDAHRGIGITKPKFSFGVDGLVSATPDLLLSVRSADCVPVLLYDPIAKVCGAVHAGWRGTAAGIVRNAVAELERNGALARRVLAAIGPCIGPCCYEVGADVYRAFAVNGEAFLQTFRPHAEKTGTYQLDLTAANRLWLCLAGVPEAQIDAAGHCTRCDPVQFFSHRRMGKNRGTMSAFITV